MRRKASSVDCQRERGTRTQQRLRMAMMKVMDDDDPNLPSSVNLTVAGVCGRTMEYVCVRCAGRVCSEVHVT